MIVEWSNLTTRLGETVSAPSLSDLQSALQDVFTNPNDPEHPDTWLECGSDEGPLASLSVFGSGKGILTVYTDADMTDELSSEEYADLSEATALHLWQRLMDGDTGQQ